MTQQNGRTEPHHLKQALVRWRQALQRGRIPVRGAAERYLASKAALLARDSRALSIADGEGRNSVWLAEQGLRVDAFDFFAHRRRKAERLALSRGVRVSTCPRRFAWNWAPPLRSGCRHFIQFASPAERERLFP